MIDLIALYRIGNWCYKKHIPRIPAKIIGHTSDLPYSLFGNISDVEEKDGFAPFMEEKHKN